MAGLRRRGVPPEAIRDFVQRIGVAKANSVVDVTAVRHCSWLRVTIASLAYSHAFPQPGQPPLGHDQRPDSSRRNSFPALQREPASTVSMAPVGHP